MAQVFDFSSNISHQLATSRRNANVCVSCGQPEVHVELHSCSDTKCVKMMRGVNKWVKDITRKVYA